MCRYSSRSGSAGSVFGLGTRSCVLLFPIVEENVRSSSNGDGLLFFTGGEHVFTNRMVDQPDQQEYRHCLQCLY